MMIKPRLNRYAFTVFVERPAPYRISYLSFRFRGWSTGNGVHRFELPEIRTAAYVYGPFMAGYSVVAKGRQEY